MKSRKTTVAGVLAGLGMLVSLFARVLQPEGGGLASVLAPENAGELVAALGALLVGLFARDDDVTSEGTRAPKDAPVPTGAPPFSG